MPLLKVLSEREEKIRTSISQAEEAQKKLESLTAEGETIIAKARSEVQTIIADGKTTSDKLRNDIESKAKNKAQSIIDQAEKRISVEKEKAIVEIRGEVASLSIQIAEKLIRKNLSKEDNMELINESLDQARKVNEA